MHFQQNLKPIPFKETAPSHFPPSGTTWTPFFMMAELLLPDSSFTMVFLDLGLSPSKLKCTADGRKAKKIKINKSKEQ